MTHSISEDVLHVRLQRLRIHEDPPQVECGDRSLFRRAGSVKTSAVKCRGGSNKHMGSTLVWSEMLAELHEWCMRGIGLVCANGLRIQPTKPISSI